MKICKQQVMKQKTLHTNYIHINTCEYINSREQKQRQQDVCSCFLSRPHLYASLRDVLSFASLIHTFLSAWNCV